MKHLYIGLALSILLYGCVSPKSTTRVEPRQWGADMQSVRASDGGPQRDAELSVAAAVQRMTLTNALSLALMKSPRLAAQAWNVRGAQARGMQEKLRSNPELEVEVEELGSDGADKARISASVGTELDVWGIRRKRSRAADLDASIAEWEYEAARLGVLADTTKAFVALLAAQQKERLAQEQLRLSQEVYRATIKRVTSGSLPELARTKARVNLATSELDLGAAAKGLSDRRQALSAMWGAAEPLFRIAEGDLAPVASTIPPLGRIEELIAENPAYARALRRVELETARLSVEKAAWLPEVSVSVRAENSRAESETSLGFGLGLSLPLFDRKQGSIVEARSELARSQHERRGVEVALRVKLAETHRQLHLAARQVDLLKRTAVPAARSAFGAAQAGYVRGKTGLLDVLDAQGTLFKAEARYVDALVEYHDAVADLQRLIGRSLNSIEMTRTRSE